MIEHLGRHQDGVDSPVGRGPVGRFAGDGEDDAVGPGHDHARAVADMAHVQVGGHVEGAHRRHLGVIQDAGGHHALGAGIAHRRAFFGGLEDEDVLPGQAVLQGTQETGGAQADAQVEVMAAGVHDPIHLGAPGEPDLLNDGQGVHVGPPGHRPAGAAALKHPYHAVAGDAGGYRQAQIPEIVRHEPGGMLLLVRELRVLMKLPAPGHELRVPDPGPGL